MHAANKTLAVRVEPATQVSAEEWNTGGYDWRALGQVADKLVVPAPIDPRAYASGAEMEQLLRYTTNEVDRSKVAIELPGQSVERSGNYLLLKGYQEALKPLLGTLQAESGENGNMTITLDNPRLQGQVQWDDNLGMYFYTYVDDQGLERTVYVESAGSLGRKLDLLRKYNVSNVNLQMPAAATSTPLCLKCCSASRWACQPPPASKARWRWPIRSMVRTALCWTSRFAHWTAHASSAAGKCEGRPARRRPDCQRSGSGIDGSAERYDCVGGQQQGDRSRGEHVRRFVERDSDCQCA